VLKLFDISGHPKRLQQVLDLFASTSLAQCRTPSVVKLRIPNLGFVNGSQQGLAGQRLPKPHRRLASRENMFRSSTRAENAIAA
jgi:hypothetical protein